MRLAMVSVAAARPIRADSLFARAVFGSASPGRIIGAPFGPLPTGLLLGSNDLNAKVIAFMEFAAKTKTKR